jgi:catechol 2,3-dioxygenase-like lactoylglutathione lyase family enzyme
MPDKKTGMPTAARSPWRDFFYSSKANKAMDNPIRRPRTIPDPTQGLLRSDHFQIAYATNDINRACDLFHDRFGIHEFRRLEGQLPAGGQIRVELAWVGTVMYELLTASGPGSELYVGRLPDDDFAIRHHHLGFLIHDAPQWQALMDTIARDGWHLLSKSDNPGLMQSCFVDVPELGHYVEYLFPEPAGLAFFESVPGN